MERLQISRLVRAVSVIVVLAGAAIAYAPLSSAATSDATAANHAARAERPERPTRADAPVVMVEARTGSWIGIRDRGPDQPGPSRHSTLVWGLLTAGLLAGLRALFRMRPGHRGVSPTRQWSSTRRNRAPPAWAIV